MHWTDQLHRLLIGITDQINRLDVDARLLAESGVKLDRALYPLLSRISLSPNISVADLANLAGRDHSTVSRQIVNLEKLGLITRAPDPQDRRIRMLAPTEAGYEMLGRIRTVRRQWMEAYFADWNEADRDKLIALMAIMLDQGGSKSSAIEGQAQSKAR